MSNEVFKYFLNQCLNGTVINIKEALKNLSKNKSEFIDGIINYKDKYGMTGFMYAIKNNNKEVTRFFLYNYNPNSLLGDKIGDRLLFYLIKKNYFEIFKQIILRDKKINEIIKLLQEIKIKIFDEADTVLKKQGFESEELNILYGKIDELDGYEKNLLFELGLLDFDKIFLLYKKIKEEGFNNICTSLLYNTYGTFETINYIYKNTLEESL